MSDYECQKIEAPKRSSVIEKLDELSKESERTSKLISGLGKND